jgi:hypothetical protein
MNNTQSSIYVSENIILIDWSGNITGEVYKSSHEDFLDTVQKYQHKKWIFSYENGNKILLDDLNWTLNEWLPKILQKEPKIVEKIGVIVSNNIFNKISTKIIANNIAKEGIEVAYFSTIEEAKKWLLEN